MSEKKPPRPRQVTWAAVLASGGSLFLLVTVFETLGRLPTVQLREQVGEALEGSNLGLGVDQALVLMRYGLMVTAVAAAVALVSGIYVFQRHHGARLALTVAAVPILLTSPFTGVFMGLLVAMSASFAWSGPARDWFAGRPVRGQADARPATGRPERSTTERSTSQPGQQGEDREPVGVGGASAAAGTTRPVSTTSTSQAPPASQGYGETSGARPDPAAPGGPWSPDQPAREVPPRAVRLACAFTWIGSALAVVGMLTVLGIYLLAPDQVRPALEQAEEQVRAQGGEVPPGLITTVVVTMTLLLVVWAVGAMVLAELVRRRRDWARWLLVVSAGVSALVGIVAVPVGIPIAVLGVLTLRLLLGRGVGAWFAPPSR